MPLLFDVKGIHPATGEIVMITVQAASAAKAKEQVAACGVKMVTASPHDPDQTARLPDNGGRRSSKAASNSDTND